MLTAEGWSPGKSWSFRLKLPDSHQAKSILEMGAQVMFSTTSKQAVKKMWKVKGKMVQKSSKVRTCGHIQTPTKFSGDGSSSNRFWPRFQKCKTNNVKTSITWFSFCSMQPEHFQFSHNLFVSLPVCYKELAALFWASITHRALHNNPRLHGPSVNWEEKTVYFWRAKLWSHKSRHLIPMLWHFMEWFEHDWLPTVAAFVGVLHGSP